MDGGERPDEGPAALNSVLERSRADGRARPLEEIFPLRGDEGRARLMQETWRAFAGGMAGTVAATFGDSRSPPEIAYAIGEIVHNYFRTRGVTLTSYELRRLVAELLAQRARGRRPPTSGPLVQFASEASTRTTSWTGAEAAAPPPAVGDTVFADPPSRLVTVTPRDSDADRMADVVAKVRARLAGDPFDLPRIVVTDAIAAVLGGAPPEECDQLARLVLSELCGLGPIDRLWADRSIRAVFVNGPAALHVERAGVIEPSPERFRDRAHLEEIVGRLVKRAASPVVAFSLRDGSEGVALFPPAAPAGPVLALRRGEPGEATFERLVAARRLSRPMADLLRIATRSRLNVLVVGPERAGKTALLAAMVRDLGDARVVTLAPHREFRWASVAKVELTVAPQASLTTLLPAGLQLQPDLLIVDSLQPSDAPALGEPVVGRSARHRGCRRAAGDGRRAASICRPPGQRRSAARIVRRDLD